MNERTERWLHRTHHGDCRELLPRMITDGVHVQMCVTSPPYWGLRDYGAARQIGQEATPTEYVAQLVDIFRLVRELLNPDGTLWLILGDSYAAGRTSAKNLQNMSTKYHRFEKPRRELPPGLKRKDLIGLPWKVAFALRDDGWYLRSDIVWCKPNPMPESVRDRPTRAHEFVFLLAKSARYYYDAESVREPAVYGRPNSPHSIRSPYGQGFTRANTTNCRSRPITRCSRKPLSSVLEGRPRASHSEQLTQSCPNGWRNKRSVWTVATTPCFENHFAAFPRQLVEPCILAGSRVGDIVLDCFAGSGTTREVAGHLGRDYIGCEVNPTYIEMERRRCSTTRSRP